MVIILNYKEHLNELLKNPEFAREYAALEEEYIYLLALIEAKTERESKVENNSKDLELSSNSQ